MGVYGFDPPPPHLYYGVGHLVWRLCLLCGTMWDYVATLVFPDVAAVATVVRWNQMPG